MFKKIVFSRSAPTSTKNMQELCFRFQSAIKKHPSCLLVELHFENHQLKRIHITLTMTPMPMHPPIPPIQSWTAREPSSLQKWVFLYLRSVALLQARRFNFEWGGPGGNEISSRGAGWTFFWQTPVSPALGGNQPNASILAICTRTWRKRPWAKTSHS